MLLAISGSQKDQELTLTIDIDELLLLTKVSNSNFYSDTSSWKTLSVEFLSPDSNQVKPVPFALYEGQSSMDSTIKFSSFFIGANAVFSRILIHDKGNGYLSIGRDDLPNPSLFDFTLS